jgi:hypothetical protein
MTNSSALEGEFFKDGGSPKEPGRLVAPLTSSECVE